LDIQELVSRARILFSEAPKRLEVFKQVNGKSSGKEIARKTGKPYVPTLNDLQKMRDLELIQPRMDKDGKPLRKDDSIVYEKVPLIRHIPISYFSDPTQISKEKVKAKKLMEKSKVVPFSNLHMPDENEVLDVCRSGEDQIHEFKAAGTEVQKLTREIAAFANTRQGGLIFYGVEDDGTIAGTDKRRQELDQPLQNSVRNAISPALTIDLQEKDVLGYKLILIRIPPWNKKDVYQFDGRVYLRHGTNVFFAKPEESKKLHEGIIVI
jgi:hypothetical protein